MDWTKRDPFVQVARLIRWLMSPLPSDRPSAREVLRSEFLPPRVGDEQIEDLLRSIEADAGTYDRVLDGVFHSARGLPRSVVFILMEVQRSLQRDVLQLYCCTASCLQRACFRHFSCLNNHEHLK